MHSVAIPSATARSFATCSTAGSTSRRASSRPCSSPSPTGTRKSTAPSRLLEASGSPATGADLWDTISADARRESKLWNSALRSPEKQDRRQIFSRLGAERYALGIETIYEGYLLHYGQPRLFAPEDDDTALLLGDYLYAHGLVRIEEVGSVEAVSDLAELIALCAYLQAEQIPGDGPLWAATAAVLGRNVLDDERSSLRLDNDPGPLERLARESAGDHEVSRSLDA